MVLLGLWKSVLPANDANEETPLLDSLDAENSGGESGFWIRFRQKCCERIRPIATIDNTVTNPIGWWDRNFHFDTAVGRFSNSIIPKVGTFLLTVKKHHFQGRLCISGLSSPSRGTYHWVQVWTWVISAQLPIPSSVITLLQVVGGWLLPKLKAGSTKPQ